MIEHHKFTNSNGGLKVKNLDLIVKTAGDFEKETISFAFSMKSALSSNDNISKKCLEKMFTPEYVSRVEIAIMEFEKSLNEDYSYQERIMVDKVLPNFDNIKS